MRTSHKNTAKIIIGIFAVLLVGLMVFNMYRLNSKYPSGKIIAGESAESVTWAGCEFKIENAEIMTLKQLIGKYKFDPDEDPYGLYDNYVVFEISVEKKENDEKQKLFEYDYIAVEKGGWFNQQSPIVSEILNSEYIPLDELRINEKETLIIAIGLIPEAFSDKSWENFNINDVKVVLAVYPEKVFLNSIH